MHDDDRPIGRLLSRREAMRLFGALGLLPLASRSLPSSPRSPSVRAADGVASAGVPPQCVVRPAQTLGPYYVDERLDRSDVRADPGSGALRDGIPLVLTMGITRMVNGTCTPFAGAVVDIWQCDAAGVYSDVRDPSFDTTGQKWLRGYQVADREGRVTFTTIYPGWYDGRTVHIHFKVRTSTGADAREFVSQLYFDDAYTDAVFTKPPYAGRPARRVRNANDGIFRRGGDQLMVAVRPTSGGHEADFAAAARAVPRGPTRVRSARLSSARGTAPAPRPRPARCTRATRPVSPPGNAPSRVRRAPP
jgi:protocatechuate 3,4-dioxygenase beta subunit